MLHFSILSEMIMVMQNEVITHKFFFVIQYTNCKNKLICELVVEIRILGKMIVMDNVNIGIP